MLNKFWFDAKNINCFKNGFRVIKDLNLKIAYSENVILIGPNGSGKSSLIEIINRNIYPVVANESKLKIFDKEIINLWELRNKISTVNNDIKNRINPNLQVFDLILSGLYGRYCYVQNKSERDSYKVEKIMKKKKLQASNRHANTADPSRVSSGKKRAVSEEGEDGHSDHDFMTVRLRLKDDGEVILDQVPLIQVN